MSAARLALSLLAATALAAQEDPPKFTAGVDLVNVGFSVRDRNGRLLADLSRDDFRVFENGKQQEIKLFAREQDQPLIVGLLIDRSGSQEGFEADNIATAVAFFRRVIREQDRAFVVAFGNRIRLVCGPTNDSNRLQRALREMDDNYDEAPRVGPPVRRSGGSAVLDALYWTAEEKLSQPGGRKALIMIGDGRENASQVKLMDTIERLQQHDVLFYGLDNGGTRSGQRDPSRMPRLAEETGGREFKLSLVALADAFATIEQELRTMYSLGFVSSNAERDGRFRKLEIRPLNREHLVRARPGYYAR